MTFRLGEQQASPGSQDAVRLGEERLGLGQFVYDEDAKDDIDASREILDAKPRT